MTNITPDRRPGDLLLDRYSKDATPEEREYAREAFRDFGRVLAKLGEIEWVQQNVESSIPVRPHDGPGTIPLPL